MLIANEFRAFAERRAKAVRLIKVAEIESNPFLLDFLVRELGAETTDEIGRFLISKRLERGAGTSMGRTLQSVARIVSGHREEPAVRGVDIQFDQSGTTWLVRVRSGPGINVTSASESIDQLTNAANDVPGARLLLGICYGTVGDMNPTVENRLRDSGVEVKAGEGFWEFLAKGDEGTMAEVEQIAKMVAAEKSALLSQLLDARVSEVARTLSNSRAD